MNSEIAIIYKEVGKKPELIKVKNELYAFQELLVGELDYIQFHDITILARKDRKNLQANIYLNTTMLNIRDRNIRGNIIITGKKNEEIKPLNKEQAIRYVRLLEDESFDYENLNKAREYAQNSNTSPFILEKVNENIETTVKAENSKDNIEPNDTLKMILAIQTIILRFIKKNEN